jgi:hypothetical protein
VSVEQAQEGVFLTEGIRPHQAAIGLQHEDTVGAGGERESDAKNAAGDVKRIDWFAGFGQGSLMKVEGGVMMDKSEARNSKFETNPKYEESKLCLSVELSDYAIPVGPICCLLCGEL